MASSSYFLFYSLLLLESINSGMAVGCGKACKSDDDCDGQLACISGKCKDDPDVGTQICKTTSPSPSPPPPSSGSGCKSSGTFYNSVFYNCDGCCEANTKYTLYKCSPAISKSGTSAILTLNHFEEDEEGGGPSECDNQYHSNSESVVALSTGWYNNGSRCFKSIKITASNGRSTTAKVVDECDSTKGCDEEHGFQYPCRNNVVDGSPAVWQALGLNQGLGEVKITWTEV